MTEHELKIWPEEFARVCDGSRPFEIRKEDDGRKFAVGDRLVLKEWDPATKEFTGKWCARDVTYLVRGPKWGVPIGMAILGMARVTWGTHCQRCGGAKPSHAHVGL